MKKNDKKNGAVKKKEAAHTKYMGCRMIEPLPVSDSDTVVSFVDDVFAASGYNSRRLAEACTCVQRMIDAKATITLTLAGAMTPIGMSGPIIDLIKSGFVDMIVSTGANIYHDLHRTFSFPVFQGRYDADDGELSKRGIARIYDTYIMDDKTLLPTDRLIGKMIQESGIEGQISSATLHNLLGYAALKTAPSPEKSFVAAAAKYGVPIFTPSPGDSSVGMNMVVPTLFGVGPQLNPILDIIESTAIVHAAKKNGVIVVGGGAPKNFYMQTQPTLWQILYDDHGGHDFFVQLTTDSPQWGGLSGATPAEAKSWGKIKEPNSNCVVVYSCASLTFPILAKYALETREPIDHKQLYPKLPKMVEGIKKRALGNEQFRKVYAETLKRAGVGAAPAAASTAAPKKKLAARKKK